MNSSVQHVGKYILLHRSWVDNKQVAFIHLLKNIFVEHSEVWHLAGRIDSQAVLNQLAEC